MIKKLLNIRSVSDLKDDIIKAAKETKRQVIKPDGHIAAETVAHQVAHWVAYHREVLEFKGLSHADAKQQLEDASKAVKAANATEAAAHVALLKECGGFEGATARERAGLPAFDATLEATHKQAQRASEVARREELELMQTTHKAAQHERAKQGAALILAQILGAD